MQCMYQLWNYMGHIMGGLMSMSVGGSQSWLAQSYITQRLYFTPINNVRLEA